MLNWYDEVVVKKNTTHYAMLILLFLGFLAVSILFVIPAIFSGSFSGKTFHNFGIVQVELPLTTVEHVFSFVNESDQTIRLVNAVPTCGCTTTEWPKEPVAPGEELLIPVHLRLQRSQMRKSNIKLEFDNDEVMVLQIRGYGRITQALTCDPRPIPLLPDDQEGGTWALLNLEWYDAQSPRVPSVVSPESVSVKFENWVLNKTGDANKATPDRWTLKMQVFLEGALKEDQLMELNMEGNPSLVIPLEQTNHRERPRFRQFP